jgi:hypothetical protein
MGGRPNTSRRLQPKTTHMTIFDVREAARQHCKRAIAVLAAAMEDEDPRVRVAAAEAMLSRGYGKPEIAANVNVNHSFVECPKVLDEEAWIKKRQAQLAAIARSETDPHGKRQWDIDLQATPVDDKKPN